ncbi:MAG: SpoIIE family protein phosphatase [Candidatus Lambdaproteobacteria bacterium]|nr:SpoIIE family protein phosphatase [Candidatus Lambdaproteobacteria bacterium]
MTLTIKGKLALGLAAAFVLIVLGSLSLSFLIKREFDKSMIERAKAINADLVLAQAQIHLGAGDFSPALWRQNIARFAAFYGQVKTQEIIRIKVWAPDGTIIYSDATDIRGKQFPDNELFRRAISGETAVAIKPPVGMDNRNERGYEQLMEVYVPIRFAHLPISGVIEVYVKLDFVNEEIRRFNKFIVLFDLIVIAGIAVLGVVTFVFLTHTIVSPVLKLRRAAGAVAHGNFETRAEVRSRDEVGNLADAFNTMIIDLRQSHRDLSQAKDYLENVLSSMNDTLLVVNQDGTIARANDALLRLLHYRPEELIGKPVQIILGDAAKLVDPMQEGREFGSRERRYRAKNGEEIPILFSTSPLRKPDGTPQGVVCVGQDLTQRKAMELALVEHVKRMREDLRNAAEFQRAVLPAAVKVAYADVSLRYIPHSTVSGDVYGMRMNREGDLNVFLGDATGHGIAAAFMTMMAQIGLDTIPRNVSPQGVLNHLNRVLSAHESGRFMTGIFMRVNQKGHLRVANAGHPSVVIIPADGTRHVMLKRGGTALGMFTEQPIPYEEDTYRLGQGDKVFVFTDGIAEWPHPGGELFGYDRLIEVLEETRGSAIDTALDAVLARARDFAAGNPCQDDVTILGFEYRG